MCITPSYPPPHPVTIMPIATGTLANQNTLPTTVGMMEKNIVCHAVDITKAMSGASEFDTGHKRACSPHFEKA